MVKTLTVITPTIDPEFQSLQPPLTEEARQQLRDLIVSRGKCDPILVWNTEDYPIIDGHNRYDICINEGIQYTVEVIDLPDREAVIDRIARIQIGRRNATPEQLSYLRGRLYNREKQKHGGDRKTCEIPEEKSSGQNVHLKKDPENKAKTAERLSEEFGIDEKTLRRDGEYHDSVNELGDKSPELKAAALAGEIPKSSVPKLAGATAATINRLEKITEPKKRREAVKKLTTAAHRNGKPAGKPNWTEVENILGKALNRVDSLNAAAPHANLHRMMISKIKEAMGLLTQWKKSQTT
jgi:hypothetical protein